MTSWQRRLAALASPWRIDAVGPLMRARRPGAPGAARLLLMAGIHGNEPAGVEGLLRVLERWPADDPRAVVVFPFMNPAGLAAGRREDAAGRDLNRAFSDEGTDAPEVLAFRRALAEEPPFALAVDCHEDDGMSGFYAYEIAPEGERRLAPGVASRLRSAGLRLEEAGSLRRVLEADGLWLAGMETRDGVVEVGAAALAEAPGAQVVWLVRAGHAARCLTLESPRGDYEVRASMHERALEALLEGLDR